MHGGRGSTKSWDFARALLILGSNRKLFIVCAREIQKSIKESVHKLLSDQVIELHLSNFYEVTDTEIRGANGTRFVFVGIRSNAAAIKSMEAIDIFAVFEATFVSQASWEIVLPTVRRDPPFGPFSQGSEVWVEFNPELASDYTYKYWVLNPPSGTVVIPINYYDNPWFPEILRKQMEEMKARDHDSYLTIWEGKPRKVLKGSIYAKELAAAISGDRISPHVQPDRAKGVIVTFDLGSKDMCAMWFLQQIGMEHHAIDFYGNVGFGIDHFLEQIQQRKYIIQSIWLPHDASNIHQVARKGRTFNTIERQVRDAYPGGDRVRVIPRIANKTIAINAVRMLFPRLYFAEGPCADGILALQHYRYEVNPETNERSNTPLHDWASNPADALATYAQGLIEGAEPQIEEGRDMSDEAPAHGQAWMSH